jgi:hypothetical protein
METFTSKSIGLRCRQINRGTPAEVFPLLCPVREADWIDGWTYEMIFSVSGVAEKGCVFMTPATGTNRATWYINRHDADLFQVSFIRVTAGEMVVAIDIRLMENADATTTADIRYEYTALNADAVHWIETEAQTAFNANMHYWEKAINHYLQTGKKLMKKPVVNESVL